MIDVQPRSTSFHEVVAAELRAIMARNRITGIALAKRLGWKQQYLSRRLTGAVPLDVNELATIADVFQVPVEEFFRVPAKSSAGRGVRNTLICRWLADLRLSPILA